MLRKWTRLGALVLIFAVPLALLLSQVFGGAVRDLVAVPLLYLAWIGRLYVQAVPQGLLWVGLVLFGLALAVVSGIVGARRQQKKVMRPWRGQGRIRPSDAAVTRLVFQIRSAERSEYARVELAGRLGRLALRTLDRPERYRLSQISQELDAADAPAEIRRFVRRSEPSELSSPRRYLIARLWHRLTARSAVEDLYGELERVVDCLDFNGD